ncbi:MAG: Flp pilus assembly complex ATPase component TadA, partial [Desulfobacula sp.]|nr:Flp pilus assembly complex ATPase component TadA [Desulfobacula sp.]
MKKHQIDHILSKMLDSHKNVSDLNLTPGKPLQVESSGQLVTVKIEPDYVILTPFQTEIFALNLINNNRKLTETLLREGSCDLSYQLGTRARFRVNIFSRSGKYSIVLRKLETKIPTIEELNLPPSFLPMAEEKNGIIFVTGATGSGKSTSLAALLDKINETKSVHVITLEDPIEYQHSQKKSTFNQRELGMDFDTFASGLRAALRQAPKV